MTSQDDLALVKRMYQRGEISDEQYDLLRRHVLWGTPLPPVDEPAAPPPPPPPPVGYQPDYPTAPPRHAVAPQPTFPLTPDPEQADETAELWTRRASAALAGTGLGDPAPVPAGGEPAADPPALAPPRRPRRRRGPHLLVGLCSMVLAVALAAGGVWWFALRETGVQAGVYARSICSSVRDWQQAVDAGSSALVRSVAQQDDRQVVRTSVRTRYGELAGRTDALRAAVLAAGVVDVPGGRAYADSLAAAVGDQSAALRDLAARAGRLDLGNVAQFRISLQSLLTGAETAVSDVTAALARPESGTPADLRLALSDEAACAPYVG